MKKPQFVHSFSDAARTNSKEDRFRRAPFAKRIAETLSSLPDENSIAIGIYGPWGDGNPSRAIAVINWYFESPQDTEVLWQDSYEKRTRLVGVDVLLNGLQKEYGDKLQMQQPTDQTVMLAQAFVRLWMKSKESSQSTP